MVAAGAGVSGVAAGVSVLPHSPALVSNLDINSAAETDILEKFHIWLAMDFILAFQLFWAVVIDSAVQQVDLRPPNGKALVTSTGVPF